MTKKTKYHNHELIKIYDGDVIGGFYYEIYKDGEYLTCAWTRNNAKEFIDTFDGENYEWNVLC